MADESRFSVVGLTDSVPDNSNDNSVDTMDAKKRKEMGSRSTVWEHFEKIFENDMADPVWDVAILRESCENCRRRFMTCSGSWTPQSKDAAGESQAEEGVAAVG
ncbi:hypothetical protein CQW23_07905 [Capsicum baccatum]|uniref:Uncharacterized protein n=1 Tax=Capsicum baccatum TaxID=33114 RepID=A0A2G2X7I2_CAPBA|nr:hypothetical protein CQW23_07905 [Capsicum baccatum]